MKSRIALFLLVPTLILLSSCSASVLKPAYERAPSSEKEGVVLANLVDSADPRAAAKGYVKRLLRIRLRAQAWLKEFDLALIGRKGEIDIFSLPAYQKLIAARPLAERTEGKIVDIYSEAREISQKLSSEPAEREREGRAFLVVAGIRDALREARQSQAQRVLLHDLLQAMKESFPNETGTTRLEILFEPFQGSALGEAAAKSESDINSMIRALPETDDVKEEIDAAAAEFAAEKAEEERQPSAMIRYPSAGNAGNLMGFEFPRGTYALTFDDGPHNTLTMQFVSTLQADAARGTFFWITNYARTKGKIVKAVQNAGMEVANHSYMHANVTSSQDMRRLRTNRDREINESTEEFTRIYGYKPKFFRLPYAAGFKDHDVRSMIAAQGMIHVKWNIDSADWQDKNPSSVLARVEAQMRENGRGIILFHDVQPQSVQATRNLLQRHRGRVRWVTIGEMVRELNGQ